MGKIWTSYGCLHTTYWENSQGPKNRTNNLAIRARPILTVFINYLKINFMFEPTLAKFLLHQANFNCRKWAIF